MATLAQTETRERSFWQKITLGLAIFIVFGFAQFAARHRFMSISMAW
jgi:hypothetical protein